MNALISRSFPAGKVNAPPSKSMAHRLLICSCLAGGCSTVSNIAYSEDVLATIDCLCSLGARIEKLPDSVKVDATEFMSRSSDMHCRESGSTLRFMIPLAMLKGEEIRLYGSSRLLERPLNVYADIAEDIGADFSLKDGYVSVNGRLSSGSYSIRGDISSQFITGMMFALAYLREESRIEVTGTFESRSYILLTVSSLKEFGFDVEISGNTIFINRSDMIGGRDVSVEADESNAAFLDCYEGIEVLGRNEETVQGDRVYSRHFDSLKSGYCMIDLSDCPDLGPILIAMAALNEGAHFTGTRRLSIKECDRGMAMKEELEKLGASITVNDNDIYVEKRNLHSIEEELSCHNDHRIVMALTYVLTDIGGKIAGIEAVRKSFPDYFDRIKKLGAVVEEYDS